MTPAERAVKILVVEDNPTDRELLERELRKGGFSFDLRCVETSERFLAELRGFRPDIILSDYSLPTFHGQEALRLAREHSPDTPFVFVSGTIGEEAAIGALREGATDYLLKGHTKRLCQAIIRALREAAEKREKKVLQEQLFQAQKMEAIGRLAGGVAHDFNNLLTAIMGYGQLALARMSDDGSVREEIEEILKAGERAAELTGQLLAFSRRQILRPRVMSLNEAVEGSRKMLERIIGEDVHLTVESRASPGLVKADPGQVQQILLNLAVNARDAMPEGGALRIETFDERLEAPLQTPGAVLPPGEYVVLQVSDTGMGMDEEVLSHIFEPFFTTKGGKGTGLGLATVLGVVGQSDGGIVVRTKPGEGTTFKVMLPPSAIHLPQPTPPPRIPAGTSGTETILLVEDDDQVRNITARVLRGNGYEVLDAPGEAQALALAESHGGKIRLLLTDVVLRQGTGRDVAEKIGSRIPGVRVVFMSGYTGSGVHKRGIVEGSAAFLQKPFSAEILLGTVRRTLDGPAGEDSPADS